VITIGGAREGAPTSLLNFAIVMAQDPTSDVRLHDATLSRSGTIVALPDGDPRGEVVVQWDVSFHVSGIRLGDFAEPRYSLSRRKR
jgi:hypothetical protein